MFTLLTVQGADTTEYQTSNIFSVDAILKWRGQTRADYVPESDSDASAINVVRGKIFTIIKFYNSDGECMFYIGHSKHFVTNPADVLEAE